MIKNGEKIELTEQNEIMKEMNTSANSTFGLLMNLLQWSSSDYRQLPVRFEKASVLTIVNEIIAQTRPLTNFKSVQVEFNETQDYEVETDIKRLQTIIRNFTTNAIKYSAEGGKVIIDVVKDADTILINVKDFGMGIKKEYLDELLNSKDNVSAVGTKGEVGTGIGLLLAKQFADDIGGKIEADSKVGEGSTFGIRLGIGD
jgi:signal transduction histidine kinase